MPEALPRRPPDSHPGVITVVAIKPVTIQTIKIDRQLNGNAAFASKRDTHERNAHAGTMPCNRFVYFHEKNKLIHIKSKSHNFFIGQMQIRIKHVNQMEFYKKISPQPFRVAVRTVEAFAP